MLVRVAPHKPALQSCPMRHHARPCGIECRSGLPWRVYTTTGPVGTAQAGLLCSSKCLQPILEPPERAEAADTEKVETSVTFGSIGSCATANRCSAPTGGDDEAIGGFITTAGGYQGGSGSYIASADRRCDYQGTVASARHFACSSEYRAQREDSGNTADSYGYCRDSLTDDGVGSLGCGEMADTHGEAVLRYFFEEQDRVWLATHHLDGEAYYWWIDIRDDPHHLDGEAYCWWIDIRDDPHTDLAAITWKRFKELLLTTYFPQSVKRQMERDLRGMRQEDRTVAEYEREFSRLLHCVLFVVRDDEDKVRIFEMGLRSSIFRLVQASNLPTYREVVNLALIVEKCAEISKEEMGAFDRGKEKRQAAKGSS
uniref:Retrotransposon gag domain-containing protein n=1 Tax=Ananas comosus var. bracteatus TaxID=296719 RepID=A0A6V7P4S5_ANACO|nr:unnamed protein product [Ananas comosus var. bracteatus]